MRQKFPGVARLCKERWKLRKEVWNNKLGCWVKFDHPTNDYIEAMVAYQLKRSNEPRI